MKGHPAYGPLFDQIDELMYKEQGCVDWNMVEFCWVSGFWSWDDTIDDEGNILDSIKVISNYDLQEACDSIGIELDCINA